MKLKLVAALNRVHLRRKIARERAVLAEMRDNAARILGAQAERIARLEARLPTARDVSLAVEHRIKSPLIAA